MIGIQTALSRSVTALIGRKVALIGSKAALIGIESALSGSKTALGVSVLTSIPVQGRGNISSQRRVHQFHDSRKNGLAKKRHRMSARMSGPLLGNQNL